MQSTPKRIIKNTTYLYIKTIISTLVMLYVTRIVFNILGVVDYGIYNVVAGSIAILGFFRNSLTITMQRFLNHYQGERDIEKQRQVFNIGILYYWCIGFIIVILLVIFKTFLFNGILNIPRERYEAAEIVYLCLIVNTFLTVVTAPYDAIITAHEKMLFYSIIGICESVLKLIIAFFLINTTGDKLVVYAFLMMIIPLFEILVMRFYCKAKFEECIFRPSKFYNKSIANEMISFAGWTMIGSSSNIIGNHGANLALNHFFGAAINAVTGIANQVQGLLAIVFTNLMKSLTPVIFKSEGANKECQMINYSLLGCKYSTLLFALLAIPFFIHTPFLLRLWLSNIPDWCVLFVRLQLLRAFFEQLGLSLVNPLNATNHVKEYNAISSILSLIPLIILVILYKLGYPPYWHYIIMILVMVLGEIVTLIYLCNKYCGLHYIVYIKTVVFPTFIVVIPSFIAGCFSIYVWNIYISFFSCITISSLLFIFLSYKTMSHEEKKLIVDVVNDMLVKIRMSMTIR